MRSLVLTLVIGVACGLVGSRAPGAESAPAKPASSAATSAAFSKLAEETDRQIPNAVAGTAMPADLAKGDLEDYAAYVKWQRGFARQSWDWHLFSTKLLLFVVMSIVAFGLAITYLQFTRDGRKARRKKPQSAPAANGTTTTASAVVPDTLADQGKPSTFKLGPEGLEVTSQVIGLLVLGFSLAFFYLYVKIVYPMQEVELQKQAQSAAAPATEKEKK